MEKEEFDTVILCNGEFPTHPKALEVLHNAKYLCCCDGAAEECLPLSRRYRGRRRLAA